MEGIGEKNKYTCIDLFAGAGGFAEGFLKVGVNILLANDIWEPAALTYKENHKDVDFILKDIYELDGKELLKRLKLDEGELDIIIGGPPCQGFSTVGKRNKNDPRNNLFKEYLRIVSKIKPKVFVMENVTGILSMERGRVLTNIISSFKDIGYKIDYKVLNAADYGVPQIRERVIFIGTRLDIDIIFPEPTHTSSVELNFLNHNLKPHITLGEAIGDLPKIEANEEKTEYELEPQNDYQRERRKDACKLTLHSSGKHSPKLIEMMKYIPEGSSVWEIEDIPKELIPTSGYGNTYARLNSKVPGMTITRNFSCISSSRCIHPFSNRGLTAREAARIQSFDDRYIFMGNKSDIALQIGNAVPPLLAQSIGESIIKMLSY